VSQFAWNHPPATGNDELDAFLDDLIAQVAMLQLIGQDILIRAGQGTPEGVLAANPGSLFLRTNGGAGTTLYVKESGTGATGWVGK
jgi:hypothetical protein